MQPALAPYAGREISPGPSVNTDEELDNWLRKHLETAYHPCGTLALGSAVDDVGRVKGVTGVRVADASLFPQIPNGNLNAPTIMVAERIADFVKGTSLPPANLSECKPWQPRDWKNTDREDNPAVA